MHSSSPFTTESGRPDESSVYVILTEREQCLEWLFNLALAASRKCRVWDAFVSLVALSSYEKAFSPILVYYFRVSVSYRTDARIDIIGMRIVEYVFYVTSWRHYLSALAGAGLQSCTYFGAAALLCCNVLIPVPIFLCSYGKGKLL